MKRYVAEAIIKSLAMCVGLVPADIPFLGVFKEKTIMIAFEKSDLIKNIENEK